MLTLERAGGAEVGEVSGTGWGRPRNWGLVPPSRVATFIERERGEAQQRNLAAWVSVRWGTSTSILGEWLGRPRSTVWGWLRQFGRLPAAQRAHILQALDAEFLR